MSHGLCGFTEIRLCSRCWSCSVAEDRGLSRSESPAGAGGCHHGLHSGGSALRPTWEGSAPDLPGAAPPGSSGTPQVTFSEGFSAGFPTTSPFFSTPLHSLGLLATRLPLFLLWPSLQSRAGKEPAALRHGREGEDLPRQVGDEAGHLLAALEGAPGLEAQGHVPVEPGGQAAEGQAPLLPVQRPEQRLQEAGSRGVQEGSVACRGRGDALDRAAFPPGFGSRSVSLPGLQANMTAVLGGMRRYSEKLHGSGCPLSVSKNTPWSSCPPRQACGQSHGCWLPLLCSQRASGVFGVPPSDLQHPQEKPAPHPLPRPHVAPLQALPFPSIQPQAQLF